MLIFEVFGRFSVTSFIQEFVSIQLLFADNSEFVISAIAGIGFAATIELAISLLNNQICDYPSHFNCRPHTM